MGDEPPKPPRSPAFGSQGGNNPFGPGGPQTQKPSAEGGAAASSSSALSPRQTTAGQTPTKPPLRFDAPLQAKPKLELPAERNAMYYTKQLRTWCRRRGLFAFFGFTFYMSSVGLALHTVDASPDNQVMGIRYRYWRAKRNLDILHFKPPEVVERHQDDEKALTDERLSTASEYINMDVHERVIKEQREARARATEAARRQAATPEEEAEHLLSWSKHGKPLKEVAIQQEKAASGDSFESANDSVLLRFGQRIIRQLPHTLSWDHPWYTKDSHNRWRYNWMLFKLVKYDELRTTVIPIDAVSGDGLYDIHFTAKFTFYSENHKKKWKWFSANRYKWNRMPQNEGKARVEHAAKEEIAKWCEQATEGDLKLTPTMPTPGKKRESLVRERAATIRDGIDRDDIEEHLRRYIVGRVLARAEGFVCIDDFWWKLTLKKRDRSLNANPTDPLNSANWGL